MLQPMLRLFVIMIGTSIPGWVATPKKRGFMPNSNITLCAAVPTYGALTGRTGRIAHRL